MFDIEKCGLLFGIWHLIIFCINNYFINCGQMCHMLANVMLDDCFGVGQVYIGYC